MELRSVDDGAERRRHPRGLYELLADDATIAHTAACEFRANFLRGGLGPNKSGAVTILVAG